MILSGPEQKFDIDTLIASAFENYLKKSSMAFFLKKIKTLNFKIPRQGLRPITFEAESQSQVDIQPLDYKIILFYCSHNGLCHHFNIIFKIITLYALGIYVCIVRLK